MVPSAIEADRTFFKFICKLHRRHDDKLKQALCGVSI